MSEVVLTVPCFNEEGRLSPGDFRRLLDDPRLGLLFVDDGSTDGTTRILEQFRDESPDRIEILALEENQGKSEAVRRGMLRALEGEAEVIGFADADLSTPPEEILRLVETILSGDSAVVVGSRVAGLGQIERGPVRRTLGRVFSTLGSLILRERLHDTQCGAKLFRRSQALEEALSYRFRSRWAFDVEFLGRYKLAAENGLRMEEVPLRRWTEVPGSKMGPSSMVRAGFDLVGVALDLERMKRERR